MRITTRSRRNRSEAGITLIEMLVVVTIIALFVGLVGVNLLQRGDDARRVQVKAQISNIMQALTLYKLENGTFPSTSMGLEALRVRPEGMPNWNGPYMKEIPMDAWGRPFQYKYPGEHGDEPDLISLGAEGQPGGEGNDADIVSWSSK